MEIFKFLGIIAGTLTTISFFPQAIKIIRTKNTAGISLVMYIILVLGIALWVVYGIFRRDFPIIIANAITLLPALVILYFKFNEKHK